MTNETSIQRVTIDNPFERKPDVRLIDYPGPRTVESIVAEYVGEKLESLGQNPNFKPNDLVVSVNGRVVAATERPFVVVKQNDCIVIAPALGSGGGKSILKSIAMIGLMVIAIFVPVFFAFTPIMTAIFAASVMIGGSMLLNAAFPGPKFDTSESSTTYGWSGPRMTAQEGKTIPKGYATFHVAPNVTNSFTQYIGQSGYLALKGDFGYGPARAIRNVKINGQPAETFRNIVLDKRLGYQYQSPLGYFNRIAHEQPQNRKLTVADGPITIDGSNTDTQYTEIEIFFPRGLWSGPESDGTYNPFSVYGALSYKPYGAADSAYKPVLIPRTTVDEPGHTWYAVAQDQLGVAPDSMIVYAWSDTDDHYEGEEYLVKNHQVPVTTLSGASAGTQPTTFYATWLHIVGATYPLTTPTFKKVGDWYDGSWNISSWGLDRKLLTAPLRFTLVIPNLDKGRYTYKITKLGNENGAGDRESTRRGQETWISSIREFSNDALAHPNHVLLGVRALASDQISGADLNVTAEIDWAEPETVGYKHAIAVDLPSIYLRLKESVGTAIADSSGRAHGAAAVGSPTYGQHGLLDGSTHTSIGFSGSNYIQMTAAQAYSGWGFECLLKPTALGGKLFSNADNSIYLAITAGGLLNLHYGGADHLSTSALTAGVRHHIGLSTHLGKLNFVIDGVRAGTLTGSTDISVAKLFDGFQGTAAEVVFYAYPIQPARFRAHWEQAQSEGNKLEDFTIDNPAIVAWDIMTNKLYGAGIPHSVMDVDSWVEWANYCNELVPDGLGGTMYRSTFGGTFDSQTDAWTAAGKMATLSRSALMRTGMNYTVVTDKPSEPVQMFSMGNILRGSFKEYWLGDADRANSVDIIFTDKNDVEPYKQRQITVADFDAISNGQKMKPSAVVNLFGCVTEAQAWREGKYRLLATKYLRRIVEFGANIEAIAARVGNVILVQHDVPQWGEGGRLLKIANMLRYSEQFDNAVWTKSHSGGASASPTVTANAVAGPTGTTTADTVAFTPAGANVSSISQSLPSSIDPDGPVTFSVWLRANGNVDNAIYLSLRNAAGGSAIDYMIPRVSTTWQKFSVTTTVPVSAVMVYCSGTTNTPWIHMWGAQLNLGATPGDYIQTQAGQALTLDRKVTMEAGKSYSVLCVLPSVKRFSGTIGAIADKRITLVGLPADTACKRLVSDSHDVYITAIGAGWVEVEDATGLVIGHVADIYDLDAIETRTVVNSASETDTIALTTSFPSELAAFNVYAFGVVGAETKKFRIMSITRGENLTRIIRAAEYNPAIYGALEPTLAPSGSSGDSYIQVTDLRATEDYSPDPVGGVYSQYVSASWRPGVATLGVKIYRSDDGGPEHLVEDQIAGKNSIRVLVHTGQTITLRVVGYDASFRDAAYESAPTVTVVVSLIIIPPPPPSTVAPAVPANFHITQTHSSTITLGWSPNTESDLSHYEIRFNDSTYDWASASAAGSPSSSDTTFVVDRAAGYYLIKAFTATKESIAAAYLEFAG